MLLNAAEELVGVEFLLAGSRTTEDADVKNDHIAAAWLDTIENVRKMVEIELIADRNEDVAGFCAHGFGRKLALDFEVELIHLDVSDARLPGRLFGNRDNNVTTSGKRTPYD